MRAETCAGWCAPRTPAPPQYRREGRVVSSLLPFTEGTLVADITPRKGQTPYVLFGNLLALAVTAALAGIAWRIR
jgi:apolipoprotein N-acyltransferase